MTDQPNILPDLLAPTPVQQVAEAVQNPPQELEPVAEPAPLPGPADEVIFYIFFGRSMWRFSHVYFLRSRWGFFCFAW